MLQIIYKYKWLVLPFLVSVLAAPSLLSANSEIVIKAAFIEKLTRFIEWPGLTPSGQDSAFYLCVAGENPFDGALDNLAKISLIKGRRLKVLHLKKINIHDKCHILFISASMSRHLSKILVQIKNRPVLTIGDTKDYADQGVMVNFFRDDGRIRFEINQESAAAAGITIGARVLKIARIVDGEG